MKTKVVLGLLFGDEGKGLTTSCLASTNDLVVRFNGGQNAGHTVEKDGYRHIFSSFGAGTLNGADTYISEHCCIYPKAINNEFVLLTNAGYAPKIFINPLCPVTTPFDVYENRKYASKTNNGSVGCGVGHTFKRHTETPYKLHAFELIYPDILSHKLYQIAEYYNAENRVNKINQFIESIKFFSKIATSISPLSLIKNNYNNIIFEGAQGIALDQDFGFFPNVTRASCTSKNAIEICKANQIPMPEIIYCMRSYLTRHGNGFMPYENHDLKFPDETNKAHIYQGNFRQGYHSLQLIKHCLTADLCYSTGLRKYINITCINQTNYWILCEQSKQTLHDFIKADAFNIIDGFFYSINKHTIKKLSYDTTKC